MLKVENLTASIGDVSILNGIDLEVRPGELHAIMGPNGSGKSTLCHVVMGNKDYSQGGKISIGDEDIKLSDRKFLRQSKLRGFESYGIGPKDGSDHIGGNYSAYASLSSTIPNPIPDSWNAKSIIFLDAGNVWGVDFNDSLDSNKLRSSAGLSLEWVSPLGPLSITMSENISKADGDLEESFSFQIGSNF